MKKRFQKLGILLLVGLLTGCSSASGTFSSQEKDFTKNSKMNLREKAVVYSEEDLVKDEIPLNSYIRCTGKILRKDRKGDTLEKGDRFILEIGEAKIQVFNEQSEAFKVGQYVNVYGEYYGFLKGQLIEDADR